MADERDEREGEPKIRIVDRRMLTEEERTGKAGTGQPETGSPPKLEMVGGGAAAREASEDTEERAAQPSAGFGAAAPGGAGSSAGTAVEAMEDEGDEEEPLTEAESAQLRQEMEQEQFAAIEQQMGRPLTAQEKDAVRAEMDKQAKSMASLEITPMLQQLMAEMSARAAVHLGLMPNPYTRLVARNDVQARLAIDAFAAVLDVVKPHLDAASQREYSRVLNDLRVNFVSITGSSTTGPSRIIH